MMVTNEELYITLLNIIEMDYVISERGEYQGWNPGAYVRAKTIDGIFVFEIKKTKKFGKTEYRLVLGSEGPENQVIENFSKIHAGALFDILNAPDFNANKSQKKQNIIQRLFFRRKSR